MKRWALILLLLGACANQRPRHDFPATEVPFMEDSKLMEDSKPIDPERWVGNYEAEESCGSAGGSLVYVKHVLRVLFENGVLVAYLDADGFQTWTRLKGTVHLSPGRMIVTLDHKLEGFNNPHLKKGDALIMLTDTGDGLDVVWGEKYRATC